MFRRRKEEAGAEPRPEPFTYIHRDTVITGDISATGRVRVHGTVRGNVGVTGVLEVAQSGLVEAQDVEADEVKIIGRVVATRVVARGKVEVWKGGELVGDVRAAALDIEDGARFTGRSEMIAPTGSAAVEHAPATGAPAVDAPVVGAPVAGAAVPASTGQTGRPAGRVDLDQVTEADLL